MSKIRLYLLGLVLLTACAKHGSRPALPDGSVSFAGSDTLVVGPVSVLHDSTLVVNFSAALAGTKATGADHWVKFSVDTTKMMQYRNQYGPAALLPASSYFLYQTMVRIAAGSSVSDPGQVNVIQPMSLNGDTSYVLPIVIQSVDGISDAAAMDQVLFLVVKTGHPAYLSRDGWAIAAYSSSYSTFVPGNLVDKNDSTTYWTSNITAAMPQYVTIGFNKTVSFSAVFYQVPTALKYPTQGGYPTSIHIETSMDGVNFTDNGTYAGNIVNNTQTMVLGAPATGAYMRFTSLACVSYASRYNCVFISGIKLVP